MLDPLVSIHPTHRHGGSFLFIQRSSNGPQNVRKSNLVLSQVGTDFIDWGCPIAGVSELLEVTGIGVWGIRRWRIMVGWRTAEV